MTWLIVYNLLPLPAALAVHQALTLRPFLLWNLRLPLPSKQILLVFSRAGRLVICIEREACTKGCTLVIASNSHVADLHTYSSDNAPANLEATSTKLLQVEMVRNGRTGTR